MRSVVGLLVLLSVLVSTPLVADHFTDEELFPVAMADLAFKSNRLTNLMARLYSHYPQDVALALNPYLGQGYARRYPGPWLNSLLTDRVPFERGGRITHQRNVPYERILDEYNEFATLVGGYYTPYRNRSQSRHPLQLSYESFQSIETSYYDINPLAYLLVGSIWDLHFRPGCARPLPVSDGLFCLLREIELIRLDIMSIIHRLRHCDAFKQYNPICYESNWGDYRINFFGRNRFVPAPFPIYSDGRLRGNTGRIRPCDSHCYPYHNFSYPYTGRTIDYFQKENRLQYRLESDDPYYGTQPLDLRNRRQWRYPGLDIDLPGEGAGIVEPGEFELPLNGNGLAPIPARPNDGRLVLPEDYRILQ